MAVKTRFGLEGYGVRRAGSFSGKTASATHPVGILTRLSMDGYGARRGGSFAGKGAGAAAAASDYIIRARRRGRR